MEKLKILIADDHPIFLNGLRGVIEMEESFRVVSQVSNGQEALYAFQMHKIDVAVLDIDMPRKNGLETAVEMLQKQPEIPIILLTMHKERAPFMRALEIGVAGYVLKENAVSHLVNAIHSVSRGGNYISPDMSAYLLKRSPKSTRNAPEDKLQLLTPAEKQIIELVAAYNSSKQIADKLFISEKTVNNHRMNMAKKLELSGKNSLLRFAIEHF